jgi:hypothetical protein
VRTEIKTALENITGLQVYDYVPDTVEKLPVAILDTTGVNYENGFARSSVVYSFRLLLLTGDRIAKNAYDSLDGYVSRSGSTSIYAALTSGSIGDTTPFVRRAENIGAINYRGRTFIGAEFVIDANDSN